ncbi:MULTISPECIES: hypothetical protein [unclassified Neorhizobium]|uniref:hypothetical protein n=1 Tax=unclassified Neorhizobium TaxID=2629175 RepID=UPI001FF5F1A7|nr:MULTISPECIES: hypothetical protein [unclassified Neorhizobium]MCJ9670045.1 hypothetical protein [Neorhizobium sp. SHOUNA12B]MCJ9746030.1 hypothetical protein [Neorhizobium sp. SHOUNA12A]
MSARTTSTTSRSLAFGGKASTAVWIRGSIREPQDISGPQLMSLHRLNVERMLVPDVAVTFHNAISGRVRIIADPSFRELHMFAPD